MVHRLRQEGAGRGFTNELYVLLLCGYPHIRHTEERLWAADPIQDIKTLCLLALEARQTGRRMIDILDGQGAKARGYVERLLLRFPWLRAHIEALATGSPAPSEPKVPDDYRTLIANVWGRASPRVG